MHRHLDIDAAAVVVVVLSFVSLCFYLSSQFFDLNHPALRYMVTNKYNFILSITFTNIGKRYGKKIHNILW